MSDMYKINQPKPADPAGYLKDKWVASDAINKLLRGEDSAEAIVKVLRDLSYKHDMGEVALIEESAQSDFDKIHKVLNTLGFELMVVPVTVTPVWPE